MLLYTRMSPAALALYTMLYAFKLALLFSGAYKTKGEKVFGPNGISTMLFLTLPIVQFPLYTSALNADDNASIVDIFVDNSNLFFSHLLHSLDAIAMYQFAFVNPDTGSGTELSFVSCPAPVRWLVLILTLLAFVANHLSVSYLFYVRRGGFDVELPFLPKRIIEATRRVAAEALSSVADSGATDGDDADAEGPSALVVRQRTQHRKMMQYMLMMLFTCDAPFFFLRCELWRRKYYYMDVFIAKNLKDFLDLFMLLLRSDASRERNA